MALLFFQNKEFTIIECSLSPLLEVQIVQISLPHYKTMTICNGYIPPTTPKQESLDLLLSKIQNLEEGSNRLIMGDINVDYMKSPELIDTFALQLGCLVNINAPTRISKKSAT